MLVRLGAVCSINLYGRGPPREADITGVVPPRKGARTPRHSPG